MILDATYSAQDRGTLIGTDEEYTESSWNLLLHLIGRGTKVRKHTIPEETSLEQASQVLDSLIDENGLFIVHLSDADSFCDFKSYGDGRQFFIEQYFDRIYGGVFDRSTAQRIVEFIFSGCTSEALRDLFPSLPGELIYDYKDQKTTRHIKSAHSTRYSLGGD